MKIWEVMQQDNVGKRYSAELDEFTVMFEVISVRSEPPTYLDTRILESNLGGDKVHYQMYTSIEDTFILEDILNAEYEEVL